MTVGEERVRTKFNPSHNSDVDRIKQDAARWIDFCEGHRANDSLSAFWAQYHYEAAAMWAVKLATAAIPPGAPHISTKSTEPDSH